MRLVGSFLLIVVLLCMTSSCQNNTSNEVVEPSNMESIIRNGESIEKIELLYVTKDYITIAFVDDNEYMQSFKTFFINVRGDIKKYLVTYSEPKFTYIDESILEISNGAGPGVYCNHYFDISRSILTDTFLSPIAVTNEAIAYVEYSSARGWVVVIQNLWDKEKYYKEYLLDLDAATVNDAMNDAMFINGYRLGVDYLSKNGTDVYIILE